MHKQTPKSQKLKKTPIKTKKTTRKTSLHKSKPSPLTTPSRSRAVLANPNYGKETTPNQVPTTHGVVQSKSLRVAHLTDLHFFSKEKPTLSQMLSKRLAGYFNLIALKRRSHFSDKARHNTIQQIELMNPDLIVCTGDLSSTGLDVEFDEAFRSLKPLMDKYPFVLIPGNHDTYTPENTKEESLAQRFSNVMHTVFSKDLKKIGQNQEKGQQNDLSIKNQLTKEITAKTMLSTTQDNLISPDLHAQYPNLSLFLTKTKTLQGSGKQDTYALVIGLNPCRDILTESSGLYPREQLQQLTQLLNQEDTGKLFVDSKTGQATKPFIILATHYPVVERRGADYTSVHPKHGVTNNHELLAILDNSNIKPGLIIHGHDHLGAATGIVTQRNPPKLSNPLEILGKAAPQVVKTFVASNPSTLCNISTTEDFQWKYSKETLQPQIDFLIPTVKDITHAYSNTYNSDSLQQLQQHLVDTMVEQHGASRARENYKRVKFKEMDLVSGFFSIENIQAMHSQHGSFFHTSAPLKIKEYLEGKLKPFSTLNYVPKQYRALAPQFYDEASKVAHAERLKKKEQQLTDYYNTHPTHRNPFISIADEANDLARREERDTVTVDLSNTTELSANLTTDVVIPIHNPGSGALAGTYMKSFLDWPKFAGFNIYSLTPRPAALPQAKGNAKGYVTSDFYTLGVQHCIQDTDLAYPKTGSSDNTPYTYVLRTF